LPRPTAPTPTTGPARGFWPPIPARWWSRRCEASYLIGKYLGPRAEAALLGALATERYRIEALTRADLRRAAQLVGEYADLPLGATDAAIVVLSERLGATRIATLDRRHFTIVRPQHVEAFTLEP
jgi:predicted nucleic acid-binding protein